MSKAPGALSPFVYWGQTNSTVSLRIDLRNVKNPLIDLKENCLTFMGNGIGAKGFNEYAFIIEFYSNIEPNESFYKIIDRNIEFVIKKKEHNNLWPRLTQSTTRYPWIKVDFDKIQHEESDEEDIDDWDRATPNSFKNLKDKDFGRGRKSAKRAEDFRKSYLFMYNIFQFVGFLFILLIFLIRYVKESHYSLKGSYNAVGRVMKFLHYLQILEILHPLLGYTKGTAMMPAIQLFGRLFFILIMIDCEPNIQTEPVVFYLFLIYSLIEVIRYPYYMLHVFNINIYLLTWLRYSAWIILQPLGFLCEGVIAYQNIHNFEKSGKFSLTLPNPWNFSFNFPLLLRLYLLIGIFPALYFMMSHMNRQRIKVLKIKKHPKKLT